MTMLLVHELLPVCMYVCMHVCMCVCVCVCICICWCIWVCTCVYMRMFVVHVCVYVYNAFIIVNLGERVLLRTCYMHSCMCLHTYLSCVMPSWKKKHPWKKPQWKSTRNKLKSTLQPINRLPCTCGLIMKARMRLLTHDTRLHTHTHMCASKPIGHACTHTGSSG